jgi:hypothetical protein
MASHSRNIDIDMDKDNNSYNKNNKNDILITPWEVHGDLEDKNYVKLIEKFGTQSISQEIIEKIKKLTGEVHPLIKSQYFFSHRDLDWILNKYEKGEPFISIQVEDHQVLFILGIFYHGCLQNICKINLVLNYYFN